MTWVSDASDDLCQTSRSSLRTGRKVATLSVMHKVHTHSLEGSSINDVMKFCTASIPYRYTFLFPTPLFCRHKILESLHLIPTPYGVIYGRSQRGKLSFWAQWYTITQWNVLEIKWVNNTSEFFSSFVLDYHHGPTPWKYNKWIRKNIQTKTSWLSISRHSGDFKKSCAKIRLVGPKKILHFKI